MEYVPGPNVPSVDGLPGPSVALHDVVQQDGVLSVHEAVDLLIKLCRAVEFAHDQRVIHRDLKPSLR